jgi:hypothetical protein
MRSAWLRSWQGSTGQLLLGLNCASAPSAAAERGALSYLQFYNLTCNDCNGWRSTRCLNGTSCALPVTNCTCAADAPASVPSSPSPSPSLSPSPSSAVADPAAVASGDAAAPPADGSAPSSRRLQGAAAGGGSGGGGPGNAVAGRRRLQQAGACNYTQFS